MNLVDVSCRGNDVILALFVLAQIMKNSLLIFPKGKKIEGTGSKHLRQHDI